MKRKLLVFILVVSSLLLCACDNTSTPKQNNEIFTLHNGVRFGMSADEVTQTEANAGVKLEEASRSLVWPQVDSLESESLTVAGQPDSTIFYVFNDNKLTSCIYYYNDFVSFFTGEKSIGTETVLDALQEKYGSFFRNDTDVFEVGIGFDALDQYRHMKKSGYYDGSRVSEKFYQWLYPVKDGYVDIMLLTLTTSNGETRIISYSFRSETEVAEVLEKSENQKKQLVSDL